MSERETEGLIAQAVPWSQAQPLLPCPFCGQRVYIRKGVNAYGHCKTEGCYANRGQIIPLDDAKQVDAWNRRAQPTARPWGWDYKICTGCSASLSNEEIAASGKVSCCPDRRMVTVRELVDAYEAQTTTKAPLSPPPPPPSRG